MACLERVPSVPGMPEGKTLERAHSNQEVQRVPPSRRLIVVANRLPVSAYRDPEGKWQLQVSAGGLVSALMGVAHFQTKWIGWPGVYVEAGPERDALTSALHGEGYAPVYLDQKMVDLHYNGFCNSVLWQLFHYVPLNIDSKLSETRTLQFQWAAHQMVNRIFGDAVMQHYQEGDIIWVQDYHLMLLPAVLKERRPNMKVGFFLHTPFPSSEIYRTLPVREELLRSVLRADLIGFHTYDYARHFVSACTRILGLEATPEGVEDDGSLTHVAAFPIGIDPDRFTAALGAPEVRANVAQLLNRYAGRKVMLGVDRLDMIKGIPQKLLAFEKFLEEHPEWCDRVLLVQIAVPSRTDVPEYQRLRSMVHEVVGRINGRYGTLTHVPIYHLDRQLSFHELVALYAITDVALVTSLRDGMNLVSYEYVACQRDNAGVLVLSEFAGAAQSLGAGALLVNPWNVSDLAAAIGYALRMPERERRERHRHNYAHVTVHTAQTWADTFISELDDTAVEAELRTRGVPPPLPVPDVAAAFGSAAGRLLVLGYNATLTPGEEGPGGRTHRPGVVVFSGSEKEVLEEVFAGTRIWLAAENGMLLRPPGATEWVPVIEPPSGEWMDSVSLVFEYFCERTPRSFVEQREHSIVWNYRAADVEFGRLQARDLLQHLISGPISSAPVDVVRVVVFSGSEKEVLEEVFAGTRIWLAAENGMLLRPPGATEWVPVIEPPSGEWMDSVSLVFEYFCERTPRSFVEQREHSIVWNYRAADVEFGRLQARDLLQHLISGPISSAPVDVVRGGRSIEVRPVGVSKGASLEKVLQYMADACDMASVNFVLAAGHFLQRDENLYALVSGETEGGLAPAPAPAPSHAPAPGPAGVGATRPQHHDPGALGPAGHALSPSLAARMGMGGGAAAAPVAPAAVLPAAPSAQDRHRYLASSDAEAGAVRHRTTGEARRQAAHAAHASAPGASTTGGGAPGATGGSVQAFGGHELPFAVPPRHCFTCAVGRGVVSRAAFTLSSSAEVAALLRQLALTNGATMEQLMPVTSLSPTSSGGDGLADSGWLEASARSWSLNPRDEEAMLGRQ
ncbi:Alpha,alpha-trehalose-phosphate synthase [UDP-forming] 1 [Auxenochlorella protothecoides]|uniref:alpha,alpha-trehalose-phosphate synthase (UDP-forming) n=1 Tax=Auxenochlorella protothecoides TaxID=3075 RepID=A0A087SAX7_AUXPR|nr:Alpha,alpha-trehalose-phosphate synthase [UDP-forming] 1 [Auxenochlorella protothecoides]KFM22881.1 Alpha,alpha-trehalose-phosphate synthase [UDP-forming] 1 [Auxenochlorella protothecoides]